jgi:hypothetical protein
MTKFTPHDTANQEIELAYAICPVYNTELPYVPFILNHID